MVRIRHMISAIRISEYGLNGSLAKLNQDIQNMKLFRNAPHILLDIKGRSSPEQFPGTSNSVQFILLPQLPKASDSSPWSLSQASSWLPVQL